MNATQKAVRHWSLQRRLGHWRPAIVEATGKLESPRPASSYRGARRNHLRQWREKATADLQAAA